MKQALIISASPNIGHISSVIAWCQICEKLGYKSYVYVADIFANNFNNKDRIINKISSEKTFDIAVINSPEKNNLKILYQLKKHKCNKIIYIFHEPSSSLFNGNLLMSVAQDIFQILTIKMSNIIFLPSEKALNVFKNRFIYRVCNNNFHRFPLIFTDELTGQISQFKKYFSFIGHIIDDHAFKEFLNVIVVIIKENLLPDINILIATRSSLESYILIISEIQDSPRLKISANRILENEEINEYYNNSFLVWNAYNRTTQSGVTVKSFMFGTPVIYLRCNQNEFCIDKYNAIAIDSNLNIPAILSAIKEIHSNINNYSINARNSFFKSYFYECYIDDLKTYINIKDEIL